MRTKQMDHRMKNLWASIVMPLLVMPLLVMLLPGQHALAAESATAQIFVDGTQAPAMFAVADVERALRARGLKSERRKPSALGASLAGPAAKLRVMFISFEEAVRREAAVDPAASDLAKLQPEGFMLRKTGTAASRNLWIIGKDAAGSMYGGLELAEQIRVRGLDRIEPMLRNPYMPLRGTKFNIPLDLRSPSYSDMSDAGQENIATVWDFDFWRAYLDSLARHRYNHVSLWNLHPFPSMVKVPEYPVVALADVWRTRIKFEEDYPTRTTGLVTPEMLAHKDVIRQLTIEQKIAFWRRVMEYARDRNIEFHVVTWNIFTYGVDGKYGISDSIDNPRTIDYFRASVREMFRTYPLLRGIGLTTGENMGAISGDSSFEAKENWAFATYGQGVLDAARAEPKRRFRLIHRQHETRAQDIARTFKPVLAQPNVDFVFSFKYAQAHVLSSTRQTFHQGYLESLGDLRTLWTLRNDDALMYRWAAPDFVREFMSNIPREQSAGYYFGSDMWVWGREFLSIRPAARKNAPRQLELDKHWLHFLLWGRLGYDPKLGDERIVGLVGQRFPRVPAEKLLAAWQSASMVYPLTTGFHWADFDFQWYIEGCRSRPGPAQTASGFHDVNRFITQGVHPGTDNITIPRYVAALTKGQTPQGTTPLQVADKIDAAADAALAGLVELDRLPAARAQPELASTLGDIRIMALLGKYYAAKIRGATNLAMFRENGDRAHQEAAVSALTQAAAHWNEYIAQSAARYQNPLWTNRVGLVDWKELKAEVANDIRIAERPR